MKKYLLLLPLLAFLALPALADNVSFSFAIVNAPGGIGDFSGRSRFPHLTKALIRKLGTPYRTLRRAEDARSTL